MSFKTDGSSHHNGISGEKIILDQVRNNPALQTYLGGIETASHLGGTANKADIQFRRRTGQVIGISVKTRSSSSGTFDWVNTSAITKCIHQLHSVETYCGMVGGSHSHTPLSKQEAKGTIDACRAELKDKIITALNQLGSKDVRQILKNSLEKYTREDEFYVSVHYKQESRSEWFEFNSGHPIVKLIENPRNSFYLKGKQGSRVIWCEMPDGSHYNTMIRLRVGLNNGIGALLAGKKWSSNPTSTLVLKLQQDTPEKLLEQIKDTRSYML